MNPRTCTRLFVIAIIAATAPAALAQSSQPVEQGERNVPEFEPAFPEPLTVLRLRTPRYSPSDAWSAWISSA